MWISSRDRRTALGASVALFVCALTWSSEGLASCGQHAGNSSDRMATSLAHFDHAAVLFGADSVRNLTPSSAFSCPQHRQPDVPTPVSSIPVRTEPWADGPSSLAPDPSSQPLTRDEDRRRPRPAPAPIDRPPREAMAV